MWRRLREPSGAWLGGHLVGRRGISEDVGVRVGDGWRSRQRRLGSGDGIGAAAAGSAGGGGAVTAAAATGAAAAATGAAAESSAGGATGAPGVAGGVGAAVVEVSTAAASWTSEAALRNSLMLLPSADRHRAACPGRGSGAR